MLVLSNDDAEELLSMPDCIEALQGVYADAALDRAVNGHRSDILAPTAMDDAVYSLKMMGAVVPAFEIGALRLNSDVLAFPETNGQRRKIKISAAPGDRWVGLVLLFSTRTGEPLAIFPDGVVQRMRVGATSALGVRHLAREDACSVAIIGTGWQAGAQAMGVAAVRPVTQIRCYSPNLASRHKFAADIERLLNVDVARAESPEQALKSADIVLCATNSLNAVFPARSIEPGMHLGSIRDGEIDRAALERADRVVIHHPQNMTGGHVVAASGVKFVDELRETSGYLHCDKIAKAPCLSDVIAGKVPGRTAPSQVSCFLNYHGLGFQFAAAGAVFYQKAIKAGRGRELPTDWFTETVHP